MCHQIIHSDIMTGTGNFTVLESAAASAVGTDLLANEWYNQSGISRVVVGAGLVGSTNAGDAAIEILVNGSVKAKLYNTTGGANKIPTDLTDILKCQIPVPAQSKLQAKIVDAGVGNVLALTLQIVPMPTAPPARSNFRRGRGRRFYRRY